MKCSYLYDFCVPRYAFRASPCLPCYFFSSTWYSAWHRLSVEEMVVESLEEEKKLCLESGTETNMH